MYGYAMAHINTRILQTIVSGIPLVLGLGTRTQDPNVYVDFLGAPNQPHLEVALHQELIFKLLQGVGKSCNEGHRRGSGLEQGPNPVKAS